MLIPDNAPINAFLELIEQMSTHSGRCRNKILENEVSIAFFLGISYFSQVYSLLWIVIFLGNSSGIRKIHVFL